jgi:RNA polymerase sigma-70 factor (ECF subfamily)
MYLGESRSIVNGRDTNNPRVSEEIIQKLVSMARDGNENAFEQLVSIYERSVFNMAMYITRDREDALDVSQEVFVRLWQSLGRYRGDASVLTYLMTLTKNASYDLKRKKSRNKTVSLTSENEDGEEVEIDIPDGSDDANPEQNYLRKEKIENVRRAIDALDREAREIIIMRDMNGMSYAEISKAMGIVEGTVKSRLSRARQSLKKILEEWNYFK